MPKTPFPGVDAAGYFDPTGKRLQLVADSTALTALGTTLGTGDAGFQCYQVDTNAVKVWTGSAFRSIATA
jgi:hypothetical protein